jgi:2-dehydropantoate 2-reductase
MKICIYGAGAVGGLIAARLAQSGHEVSVVARGAHLTAILKDGLRIVSEGKQTATRLKANNDTAKLGPQDCVIVAVKGQSLPGVAANIAPLLGDDTSIVTAMNGVPWWFFDRLAFGGGKLHLEHDIPLELLRAGLVRVGRRGLRQDFNGYFDRRGGPRRRRTRGRRWGCSSGARSSRCPIR